MISFLEKDSEAAENSDNQSGNCDKKKKRNNSTVLSEIPFLGEPATFVQRLPNVFQTQRLIVVQHRRRKRGGQGGAGPPII